ncbi:MAG TPA: TetR family transcriptional regulator [Solirubrobacterales bacterium]|nr:TetR family transcriptional regulator [Solirubrobacterales bacterium]
MVATPWGDSASLRQQRLRPGRAQSRAEARENQRARIFGAIVASTAERGYEGTRLEDIERISGVSGRSFYDLFPDKEAAFVAALERLLGAALAELRAAIEAEEGTEERLRSLAAAVEAQAPAARMCLIEAAVAGERPAALLEDAIGRTEGLLRGRLARSPAHAEMPAEMASAAVGAVLELLRRSLMREDAGLAEVTPGLLAFLAGFEAPSGTLRAAARPPERRPEAAEASDHAERALRAFEALLAGGRLAEVTMEQVGERAQMSRRTLYANFPDRQGLMLGAIDAGCAQLLAVALPAYHRHEVPAEGLRAAIGAVLALLASRPNLAHLLLVASEEGGSPALRRRHAGLRPLRTLLRTLPAAPPGAPLGGIAVEATLGGLLALMRRRLLEAGPAGLPALGPICTYIALAPLIGAAQATRAAAGRAYRRSPADLYGTVANTELGIAGGQMPMSLGHTKGRSVAEIAEEAGIPAAEAEARVAEFVALGLFQPTGETKDGETLYLSVMPVIPTPEWARIERAERESQSAEIVRLMEIEMEEALEAGTFDSRPDRHLVRLAGRLDREALEELHDRLALITDECLEIERRARERLEAREEGTETWSMRVHLVSFEAAPPEKEA